MEKKEMREKEKVTQVTPIRELQGHSGSVNAVKFTTDGNYCVSCSDDRTIKLWNPHRDDPGHPSNALLIKTYSGVHGYQILDVEVSYDNSKMVSGGGDKACFLWDISSGRIIRRLQAHTQRINSVLFNAEASLIFSGSYDKNLHIWDLRSQTRDPIQTLSDFRDSVTSIALTRTDIIAGSVDGFVRIYDLRIGQMHSDSYGEDGAAVTCVSVSYDQLCLLSTHIGGVLHLSEILTGKLLQSYRGHTNTSFKVESKITNDDSRVVSGSEDGKIHFWDLVKGTSLGTIQAHNRAISSVSYHPTNPCFLSAAHDGGIKLWQDTIR